MRPQIKKAVTIDNYKQVSISKSDSDPIEPVSLISHLELLPLGINYGGGMSTALIQKVMIVIVQTYERPVSPHASLFI